MMNGKIIYEDQIIYEQLKNKNIFFVFSENNELKDLEKIRIINKQTEEKLDAKITSKALFNNVENAFSVIPYNMFWLKSSEEKTKKYFKDRYSDRKVIVYRVNIENEVPFNCDDMKLKEMIDEETLKLITSGHSVCDVYSVITRDRRKCILKIQRSDAISGIDKEYEKLTWLEGKVRCPKVYYYNETRDSKILLREKFEGKPLYEFEHFGEKLGRVLKEFHSIPVSSCPFTSEKVENLITRVSDNAEGLLEGIKEKYPNETKESVIKFMKNTKLVDDAVIHGDCSLPNILVDDDGELCFIDVADLSISSNYYDLYYLLMSLKMNDKMCEFEDFCKGYGIEDLDKEGLKFVEIVDKTFY